MDPFEWTPDSAAEWQSRNKKTLTLECYRSDALVVRSYETARVIPPPEDSSVGGAPSKRSLQNLVFLLNNCDVKMTTMHTLTIQHDVSLMLSVKEHKAIVKSGLQKLRNEGAENYVWVREFTKRGIPHWHVFSDAETDPDNEIDSVLSSQWSRWLARTCRKNSDDMPGLKKAYHDMEFGDGVDFLGCVRVERLRSDGAGRYAGKEGAKRFQKRAPFKWEKSGRWWAASKGVVCTPVGRVQVLADSVGSSTIVLGDGTKLDVPFRNQFGKGHLARRKLDSRYGALCDEC